MRTDRTKPAHPPVPGQRAADSAAAAPATPVDLVKPGRVRPVSLVRVVRPAKTVSLVRADRRAKPVSLVRAKPVSLTKTVSLVKARPAPTGPGAGRPPARRRVRVNPVAATRAFVAGTRSWSQRPSGQLMLPLLLMLVLVVVLVATGAVLPHTTDARPSDEAGTGQPDTVPTAPDGEEFPEEVPPGGLDPEQSAGTDPGAPGQQRPADALAAWASPMSVKTGIPVVALQAYAFAELAAGRSTPSCKLKWTTLAGIGLNESNHGRGSGATLTNDGRATPPIYGPLLDGQGGRRAISDTDGGQLDGDRTWDRAIGPMQFIPGTWTRYATDADGNGNADPHDIDDAALAAGRYLCAGGRDLATVDGWWAGILAYNNVRTYAQNVFTAANDYGIRSRS